MQRDRPRLLERTLGSKTKIAVLRKMCVYPDFERTVTRLSDDVGLDKSLVSKVVKELEEDGILHVDYKGNAKVCRLDSGNFVVKNLVIPIFEHESGLAGKVASEILKMFRPRTFGTILSVSIYGSFARGNFRPKSDVDLVIITEGLSEKKKIKKRVSEISERLLDKDLLISSDIMSKNELRRLFLQKEPAILDMVENHRRLYGDDLNKLARRYDWCAR